MRRWTRYLLFASLVFLAVALYKADYLSAPRVYSAAPFFASFACLFAGLVADAFAWRTVLGRAGFPVSPRESLAAVGLSVFAKYLPGKIWAVMGRVGFVAERRSYPLAQLTSISLTWQCIVLWLGLIFGAFGLYFLRARFIWAWPILLAWLALTAFIFSDAAHRIAARIYKKLFSREIEFPVLRPATTIASLPWFVATWGFLSLGFYLLAAGLSPRAIPPSTGLGFPLSITLGIFAVIAPGGLGVREGAIVGYLALAGVTVADATAISIAARLWFLIGEAFMFAVGLAASAPLKRMGSRGGPG